MKIMYTFVTQNHHRKRTMNEAELKQILSVALKNGWRPLPHRVQSNQLDMNGPISEIESYEISAALERGIKRAAGSMPPPLMIAILETIGVLRYGGVYLEKETTE